MALLERSLTPQLAGRSFICLKPHLCTPDMRSSSCTPQDSPVKEQRVVSPKCAERMPGCLKPGRYSLRAPAKHRRHVQLHAWQILCSFSYIQWRRRSYALSVVDEQTVASEVRKALHATLSAGPSHIAPALWRSCVSQKRQRMAAPCRAAVEAPPKPASRSPAATGGVRSWHTEACKPACLTAKETLVEHTTLAAGCRPVPAAES